MIKPAKIIILVSSAVVALVVMLVFAINGLLVKDDLARCGSQPTKGGCAAADVIVAVSGGDTIARADKAIDLYHHGWAKLIIFSGAAADHKSVSNAEMMRRRAVNHNVPNDAIIVEDASNNTEENAKRSTKLMAQRDIKSAILVSSSYHLWRVKLNFMKSSANIFYRTAGAEDKSWRWWYLKPNGWKIAVNELLGVAGVSAGVHRD